MNHCSALKTAAALALFGVVSVTAQDAKPPRSAAPVAQSQPLLVAGTEFMIIESPPQKGAKDKPQKRLPIVIVVFLWIVAMFIWQLYFNRKHR